MVMHRALLVMRSALHSRKVQMRNPTTLAGSNCRLARQKWALKREDPLLKSLRTLSEELQVSVASGDLSILQNDWYVIHTGLIRLARRKRCAGIHAEPSQLLSDPSMGRWAFKATVYKSRTCKGFVGYGDADPSNVSPLVRGAEMRVAETRAVNRALRKAYGIGMRGSAAWSKLVIRSSMAQL
jgi:hypothetical protein